MKDVHSQGGLSNADKSGGVNFSRFCADVFYGRPLISQLEQIIEIKKF